MQKTAQQLAYEVIVKVAETREEEERALARMGLHPDEVFEDWDGKTHAEMMAGRDAQRQHILDKYRRRAPTGFPDPAERATFLKSVGDDYDYMFNRLAERRQP